jgi:hypothetical protein
MLHLQALLICIYFVSFLTVVLANLLFLIALRNITLRKTIINDILKATCVSNLLVIVGTISLCSYSLIFNVNETYCYIFPISGILLVYFPLFCHSLCLLARFALLACTRRVQGWSDKKLLSITMFLNFILLFPYLLSWKYYKRFKTFRSCLYILKRKCVQEEGVVRVVYYFYIPQLILLFLALYVARIEVKSKTQVNVHIGQKQQNIVTAKLQAINGICLILVSVISAALRYLVCARIDNDAQLQCFTFASYIPQYFSCFLPPFTYIIFSKTIRLFYKNKFKYFF